MNDTAPQRIRLYGVRHNNLKNFDLELPVGQLIVITGLSGSGKSSLAFDTLFAEGQRRYIETFSPYARQFFDRMDKPRVDRIEGIPPAIAIEQTNSVRTTRSTVGTMTEICDYMKVLWPHLARLYCRQCGQPVRKESPQVIWRDWLGEDRSAKASAVPGRRDAVRASPAGRNTGASEEVAVLLESPWPYRAESPRAGEVLVTFDLPLTEKLPLEESLGLVARQGYQRLLVGSEVVRLEDGKGRLARGKKPGLLTVVQDRIRLVAEQRARFMEACEQAYHFGKGRLRIHPWDGNAPQVGLEPRSYSAHFHCATCDLDYRDPAPALFSFNHPLGACPHCKGFGRVITIDYHLALPDRSKTLAEGAVKPWQTGQGAECQADLLKFCRKHKVPTDVPFDALPQAWQDWVIQGDPHYGRDAAHEWPRAWYGVKGYFRWLESKAYKMHVRVLLSRYRAYSKCPACEGRRLQPEALLYRVQLAKRKPAGPSARGEIPDAQKDSFLNLADFYAWPIERALSWMETLAKNHEANPSDPIGLALTEVRHRLGYLQQVGLGYLTLDRPTRTLSGGETERVNLTTCLGSRLVNTLFVLDEPSVGLHARDTGRLVSILENLKRAGNTVVVVEHEPSVMRAADQIVDLGPGHGEDGGHIVFQGPLPKLLKQGASLTGRYLSGRQVAAQPLDRPVDAATASLVLTGATRHNLRDLTVRVPLGRFVCLTGVSGSGKSTLVRDCLLPALVEKLQSDAPTVKASDRLTDRETDEDDGARESSDGPGASLEGWKHLARVVMVDQSPLGKTPRSNPAVYVGAFEEIRELFARTDLARQRGLKSSAFSFNSGQGQCERCRGAGFEKIEMQFLSDVFIRCPDCGGRRYRDHILEIKLPVAHQEAANSSDRAWSIADVLEASVDEVVSALLPYTHSPVGARAMRKLRPLQDVGLGYLRLGQPINTLSGGESQRLKLASYLTESDFDAAMDESPAGRGRRPARARPPAKKDKSGGPTLFIFDEPTTGLHYEDVRVLLAAFQRLVEAGHSLLVVEHNLDVIRSADWIIDLGPEGGELGGAIVVEGTLREVVACADSHTGRALAAEN